MALSNPEVLVVLDIVKDVLAGMAKSVYKAQKDGQINWFEALSLATQGTTAAATLLEAFKGLSESGAEELIDALANSDLTIG